MSKTTFWNRHLREADENYLEHFLFAFTTAMWLAVASLILFTHSICPMIFTTSTSKHVRKINEVMQKRLEMLNARRAKKAEEDRENK
jgi:hypothetical protein